MAGMGWIGAIIVGGIAGWIAEKVMGSSHGIILNIVLGIVGAIVANWLFLTVLGSTLGGVLGQLVVAVIGACILIAGARLVRRA